MNQKWNPDSWKSKTALHQPNYLDEKKLEKTIKKMKKLPPLVFAGEVRSLKKSFLSVLMEMVSFCRLGTVPRALQNFIQTILEIPLGS